VYIPETTKVYENHERRLVGTFGISFRSEDVVGCYLISFVKYFHLLGFIAPEVYDGKPHSPKVDYFSLGVIAYKLVHKDDVRLPFNIRSVIAFRVISLLHVVSLGCGGSQEFERAEPC